MATPVKPLLTTAIGRNESTVGKRWRLRRDLLIVAAHRQLGFSQRYLADAFDLPRSRVADILANLEARAAETGRRENTGGSIATSALRGDRRRKQASRADS